ncbi:UNKNOWN [Stylonychia lemnae]|uniref:Uncharacterized protein n=1 Tax=Stylonychia lemnae TaxID=5949 RepID=A0A078B2M3_STYLE|nr:UNKNOWN [Stylonychia lemnae]|eukprot:CDW87472.1 UNKNOWN [Stylonychia lemnae]
MRTEIYVFIAFFILMVSVQSLYHKELFVLKAKRIKETEYSYPSQLKDLQANDKTLTINDISRKRVHENYTLVTETFGHPDKKVTEVKTLIIKFEDFIVPLTVTENQCMFVVRRGRETINHARADNLKVGDSLLQYISLKKQTDLPYYAKIASIEKTKTNYNQLIGIKTSNKMYIGGTLVLSDMSDTCTNLSEVPRVFQRDSVNQLQLQNVKVLWNDLKTLIKQQLYILKTNDN